MKYILTLTFLIVAVSCNLSSGETQNKQSVYFNIKPFIANQSALLSKNEISCLKNFTYNEKIEILKIKKQDSAQWSKDLKQFSESDISHPKNKGLYQTDSLTSPKGKKHITYSALDKKLITRKFSIIYNEDKSIYMLIIKNKKENKLIKTNTELTFFPNKGYTIVTKETSRLGKANKYECFAQFNWSGLEN